MEISIFERGQEIGSLTVKQAGLFWEFSCKLTADTEPIRRIYVIKNWDAEYLGIPDRQGRLEARIPLRHLPQGIDTAVAAETPRGPWRPWRGTLEGVSVEEAWFRDGGDHAELALPPEEALKFPAWAEQMRTEEVSGREAAILPLYDGRLPLIETETGGEPNETLEEMDRDTIDFDLPDDTLSDTRFGGGDEAEGREADRPDV